MLSRLRRNMTLLCASGVCVIGAFLVVVSLVISERQLTERGQALFQSSVNNVSFRVRGESFVEWTWLQNMEHTGNLFLHIEDNGRPILFSTRDADARQHLALIHRAQSIASEQYELNVAVRPRSALQSSQADFQITGDDGRDYRVSVVIFRTEQGFRSVTALGDLSGEKTEILHQRLIYLALLVCSAVALLLFSWWFSGLAIRPVEQSQRQQSEFIAAASHELRAPLAVIRTSAAALREKTGSRFVDMIERECVRTGKLVDDLLLLAGADAGRWRIEFAPVELDELLADSVRKFRQQAAARSLELRLEILSPLPLVTGDAFRLQQLVDILLDNACYYTPPGGRILLRCGAQGRYIAVTVADNGPGIPPELYDKVFERFYRVDASRTQKEHYGLGLSIAREIALLHRGRIELSETAGGGLTAELLLPAAFHQGNISTRG